MSESKVVAYARILIKGKEGYILKPSKANPGVKRWQKEAKSSGTTRGKASVSPSKLEEAFRGYLSDPEAYKKMQPLIAAAAVRQQARLPYDVVAHLSRLQTAAWQGYGGANDLLQLIRRKRTLAGQFGQDHQALMEHMWMARPGQEKPQPLLTDTYDATAAEFPEWAEHVEKSLPRLGGKVLGAIPRTSAFQWDWSWGPPEPGKIRQDVGGRTILINPEATLIIAPPEGRETEFAREYFKGVKKEAPKAAAKGEVQQQLNAVWPKVRPAVRKNRPLGGKYGEEYKNVLKLCLQSQRGGSRPPWYTHQVSPASER